MMQMIFIGIGAGAATALLFASLASGSPLSMLLFYLAPLPILIAALGWSHWAALIAAVFASASLASVFNAYFFIAFLIGVGLPAWWLGYLALLARPVEGAPDGLEWYPVGHLVTWAAILSTAVVVAAILNFGTDEDTFRAVLRRFLERMFQAATNAPSSGTRSVDISRFIDLMVMLLPPVVAVVTTLTNALNLWLASRIVQISGRLRRPASDLTEMRFPAYAPALMAAAVVLSFFPGLFGRFGAVLMSSLLTAYAILGFAVMHAITRGITTRPLALGGLYAATLILGWPVLMMSILGLADTAFDLRGRRARRRGGGPNIPKT